MTEEEPKYISLQDATQYCNYSQEYLSLRARQGKLKAVKFGRNWLVRKEWLEEYLGNVEEYNHNLNNHPGIEEKTVASFATTPRKISPPENLPVGTFPKLIEFKIPKPILQLRPVVKFFSTTGIRFGFVAVLVFVLLITGIFHGRQSFTTVYEDASFLAASISKNFDEGLTIISQNLKILAYRQTDKSQKFIENVSLTGILISSDIPQSFRFVYEDINSQLLKVGFQAADASQSAGKTFIEYFQWIGQGYLTVNDSIEKNIRGDIDDLNVGGKSLVLKVKKEILSFAQNVENASRFVIQPWREIQLAERIARPTPKEGAVIIPFPEEKTAEVKGKLERAFSDKVEVEPDETGRAGIIKPLIKEAKAQEYLYLIVPVEEQ